MAARKRAISARAANYGVPRSSGARGESVQVCRFCGCSDLLACPGGCSWLSRGRCSRCASTSLSAPEELAHARRVLALWYALLTAAFPTGPGYDRLSARFGLVSIPVARRHRALVLQQLRAWAPSAASSIESKIAFNRDARRWELIGPWQNLAMDVAWAQKSMQGREQS